jgi:type IV secretion system protein TrbE
LGLRQGQGLGSIALAFTAASPKADQAAIADLLASEGRAGFATD